MFNFQSIQFLAGRLSENQLNFNSHQNLYFGDNDHAEEDNNACADTKCLSPCTSPSPPARTPFHPWASAFTDSIQIHFRDNILGKGAQKKNRKKCGLLPNSPRTPQFGIFSKKKFTPIFVVENCIFNGRNEFYAWSQSNIYHIIFKQLQTKCKTCFGGPRMILHANWKNTFPK